MTSRLPVMATVLAAYRDVFGNFPAFLRTVWLMLVLLVLLVEVPMLFLADYVSKNVLPELQQQLEETPQPAPSTETPSTPPPPAMTDEEKAAKLAEKTPFLLAGMGLNILQMLLIFCFTYGWYRQLMTGEDKGKTISFRLGKPEWQLMWTSMKVGFALMPPFFLAFGVVTGALPHDSSAPPQYDFWPYLAVIGAGVLYLQARLAAAYPATVMGETEAPVRQSWNLTRRQGLRLIAGNLLVLIPVLAGFTALLYGVSAALEFFIPPSDPLTGDMTVSLAARFVLKVFSEFFVLLLVSMISAFHAHAYAYLVRSSSSASMN